MRVAIIGGTGFVGRYVIDALQAAGHSVSTMVRSGSESKLGSTSQVRITNGDLQSQSAINTTCENCDAVIYNVGILRENSRRGETFEETQFRGVERTIAAARNAGVKRFLLMSASGVRAGGTPYQDSKFRAEELVRNSGIDYVIFRPSVIFGDPRNLTEIATQLYEDMISPPLPAIGFHTGWNSTGGKVLMSPVHVEDVARAIVLALHDERTLCQTIHLGGPETLSWPTMIERVAAAAGKKKCIVPVPIVVMELVASILDWIPQFPVTRDQLAMLAEGSVVEPDELMKLIGRDLRRFDAENLSYLGG